MKRAFLVVAIVIIGAAKANAADAAIRLYCEWKAPVGVEVGQSYLLELMFDSKLIRSTQFVNGVSKKPATFAVRTLSDVSVAGWSADSTGRIKEGLTINRLNGEAVFHHLFYGSVRDEVWNDRLKRIGGFTDDPIVLSTGVMKCQIAKQQF